MVSVETCPLVLFFHTLGLRKEGGGGHKKSFPGKFPYYCMVFILMDEIHIDRGMNKNYIGNPEVAEMVLILDPKTAVFLLFLHPEVVKMDQKFLDPENIEMV